MTTHTHLLSMETRNYDKLILQALEQADFGLTQRELSESVEIARPTVRKYCEDLLEDGEIAVVEKGSSKIYLLNQSEVEG